ncbi:MAG: type II CAAX endopeptidase family protein, partial [Chloroflexota bacterium]
MDLETAPAPAAPPPIPPARWGLRDMLWASLATLGLMLVAGVALALAIGLGMAVVGGTAPPMSLVILVALSLELLMIPPSWWWGPRKYGGGWPALGLRRFRVLRGLGLTLAALLGVLAMSAAWEPVRQRLGWASQPDLLPFFGEGLGGLALALLLGGVVAPLAEEVFFRGFLYAGLRARLGAASGVALSALLFALVHVVPGVLAPIFLMGVAFALLYEHTGSLWPCILLH